MINVELALSLFVVLGSLASIAYNLVRKPVSIENTRKGIILSVLTLIAGSLYLARDSGLLPSSPGVVALTSVSVIVASAGMVMMVRSGRRKTEPSTAILARL